MHLTGVEIFNSHLIRNSMPSLSLKELQKSGKVIDKSTVFRFLTLQV